MRDSSQSCPTESTRLLGAGGSCVSSRRVSTATSTSRSSRRFDGRHDSKESGVRRMTSPPGIRTASPIADDGDAFHFCSTCAFSAACLENGYDKTHLQELRSEERRVGKEVR